MAKMPRTYRYLAQCDNGAADDALVGAIGQLDGAYLRFAAEVLLERARPDSLPAVVDVYHRLGEDLRDRIVGSVAAVAPVLRGCIRSHELQTRLNCLDIAGRMGAASLAYLFELGLLDNTPKVRELSAVTMRRMAEGLLAEHPLLADDAGGPAAEGTAGGQGAGQAVRSGEPIGRLAQRREHLFEALLAAAQRYDSHLRPEVVEACMWFEPYLGRRLWGLLESSRSKLPRLLADMVITSDEPGAARFLLQAMAVPQMRPRAVKALSERRDPQWFRAVLAGVRLWHPWPKVRRAWGHVKDITFLYTLDEAGWTAMGFDASLPILIASISPGHERKGMLMERLLSATSSPVCRRQVLFEAARGPDWGVPLMQRVLAESNDPSEVRMAAYALFQAGTEGLAGDLVRRLRRRNDTAADGLVGLAADLIFWRLWTRFDTMQEERRVAALAGIVGFADHLKDRLRVHLAGASTSGRLRAARMVGLLKMVDVLWRDMLLTARDPSPRVRSAAVRFLAQSQRPDLRQQLIEALDDRDGRVQANAIEAIDEAGWPDRLELIIPKLQSGNSRVQANAARALARAGDEKAAEILTAMLDDGLAERRLTAIWTIQRIGSGPWVERLARIAEDDPSAAVRRRAAEVCEQLQPAETPAGE